MILRAVVLLCAGCWVASRLADPRIVGARAWALAFLAAGLIVISIVDAVANIFREARAYLEVYREVEGDRREDPPEKVGLVRYQFRVDQARWVYAILPDIAPEKIRALADGLLAGVPFSERAWRGSISNFRIIQDAFADRGLARLRGRTPQQGYKITRDGWEAMRSIKNGTAQVITPSPS